MPFEQRKNHQMHSSLLDQHISYHRSHDCCSKNIRPTEIWSTQRGTNDGVIDVSNYTGIHNALMCSTPRQPYFKMCIDAISKQIKEKKEEIAKDLESLEKKKKNLEVKLNEIGTVDSEKSEAKKIQKEKDEISDKIAKLEDTKSKLEAPR